MFVPAKDHVPRPRPAAEAVVPTSVRLPPILYELVRTKMTPGESLGQAIRRLVGVACGYESSPPPSSIRKRAKRRPRPSGSSKDKSKT